MHTKCWPENLRGRDISEDLGVDGKITHACGSGNGSMGGSCENGTEPSGSTRARNSLTR
jgi:hypothetical protein